MFAEFLLLFLIFPWVHACVGLTVYGVNVLVLGYIYLLLTVSILSVADVGLCWENCFLLLILTVLLLCLNRIVQ